MRAASGTASLYIHQMSIPHQLTCMRSSKGVLEEGWPERIVSAAWPLVRHDLSLTYAQVGLVLAIPGQIVCRNTRAVIVDDVAIGEAHERDTQGRALPVWKGCRRIRDGEIFLMNQLSDASFDGRYFGPLPMSSVIGRADPLWTGED